MLHLAPFQCSISGYTGGVCSIGDQSPTAQASSGASMATASKLLRTGFPVPHELGHGTAVQRWPSQCQAKG